MSPQENIEKFNQAYEMFEKTGAIKTGPGHFVYTYGDHGIIYINKKEIFNSAYYCFFGGLVYKAALFSFAPWLFHRRVLLYGVCQKHIGSSKIIFIDGRL